MTKYITLKVPSGKLCNNCMFLYEYSDYNHTGKILVHGCKLFVRTLRSVEESENNIKVLKHDDCNHATDEFVAPSDPDPGSERIDYRKIMQRFRASIRRIMIDDLLGDIDYPDKGEETKEDREEIRGIYERMTMEGLEKEWSLRFG